MIDKNRKEDDLDLSQMIDEYDDYQLQEKIEALRKHKFVKFEHDKENDTSNFGLTKESSLSKDENEATILMDLPNKQKIEESQTKVFSSMDEESIQQFDNHDIVEEEMTEEDIAQYLGENVKQKSIQEENNKKIVYAMAVIGCILIGGLIWFGGSIVLGNRVENNPTENESHKQEEPVISNPSDQPIEQEVPVQKEPTPVKPDNSKKIAELNGEITELQKQSDAMQKKKEEAELQADRLEVDIAEITNQKTIILNDIAANKKRLNSILEEIKILQEKEDLTEEEKHRLQERSKEQAWIEEQLKTQEKEVQELTNIIQEKETQRNKQRAQADDCRAQIDRIQKNISNLQQQRDQLQ